MTHTMFYSNYCIVLIFSSDTVKIDGLITSHDTHYELCKALRVSSFDGVKLAVTLDKIDATCLGEAGISILLKEVNPEV